MTREALARKIGWQRIIWLAGIVNVTAMLPQLWQILRTHTVEGLSAEMFWIYLIIQIAFSAEGFFKRNTMLMVCLGLSASVSVMILACIYIFR